MLISDWSSDVCSSDLEYLLALAIPRRDTKPLAKALLREFDGIGGLMAADWQAIARVPGMGDTSIAAIKIVQATMLRMLRNEVAEKPVLASWQALLDYLRADMAFLTEIGRTSCRERVWQSVEISVVACAI